MDHDIQSMTIPEAFEATASRFSDKTAVEYLGTNFTYADLSRLSTRFAAGLEKLGLTRGSKVLMYLPNSIHWLIAWLGILKIGATAAPITPIYTPFDLEYIANDTDSEAVVCTDRNFGYVTRVKDNTKIENIIAVNMADLLPGYKRLFGWLFDRVPKGKVAQDEHTFRLPRFLADAPTAHKPITADPDAIAEFIYTGGTTKHPKGVPITHRLVLSCAQEQISVSEPLFPLEENVILGSAPLFHILGQTTFLGSVLLHGGTMVLQPKVNVDAMMDAVERTGAKTLIGVPTLFRMILEHDRLDQYDLSSLAYCFCGGDVLPADVAENWEKRFGRPIYIGYGATETAGGVSMTPPDRKVPPGSMGLVLKSKTIRIWDPFHMTDAKPGDPGELLVHSDPMVSGYLNKPEETEKAFTLVDGKLYYRTADVVRIDDEGFLFFVDRTVDTIKHKGYRVSASEIEGVLQDHPAVTASCVVGIPDPKVGERIKAFVVLKKDIKGVTGYDLIHFCRRRLAAYKIPQYVEFRDMLPKSKVGKLLRREIRDEETSRRG